jgi:hypothetical protein
MAKTLRPWSHVQPLEDFQREMNSSVASLEVVMDGPLSIIRLRMRGSLAARNDWMPAANRAISVSVQTRSAGPHA